jgi:uncharacterized protein (DUF1501 family)
MSTNRREFLIGGVSAGAAAPLVGNRLAPAWLRAAANAASDSVLVVVQARGGWDLFNMLVPADAAVYYTARPNIAVQRTATLGETSTGSHLYWHPTMAPFKTLYDAGQLAVVLNVGYPQPDLSHFESEKKWYAGDPAVSVMGDGWLARYLATGVAGPVTAINADTSLSPAFHGARVPVLTSPTSFSFQFDAGTPTDNVLEELVLRVNSMWARPTADPNLVYVTNSTLGALDDTRLLQVIGSSYTPMATYPNATLSQRLQLAARYITGGLTARVYYTSSGGFDNHANLAVAGSTTQGTFSQRLNDVVGPIKAFLDDLTAHGVTRNVVVMVFSEFSRRFGENGSLGVDHGHGGIAFLAGQRVNGGLYGTYPDLAQAMAPYYNWYPPFGAQSMDFRRVYATVLNDLLGVDPAPIVGAAFPTLGAISP